MLTEYIHSPCFRWYLEPQKDICQSYTSKMESMNNLMTAAGYGSEANEKYPEEECYIALICDTPYPEGCGFLANALSLGVIVFCTLLKL